jgi:excinuclease UvrABC nuclease subunit
MPFDRFVPCTFSLVSVQQNAPAMSGVYGLSNAREWIFVGETDNIKAKLLEHLQETHTRLLEQGPTGFVFEVCAAYDRMGRQERLIQEYQPVCNRRVH